jgi:hypothetical protein
VGTTIIIIIGGIITIGSTITISITILVTASDRTMTSGLSVVGK